MCGAFCLLNFPPNDVNRANKPAILWTVNVPRLHIQYRPKIRVEYLMQYIRSTVCSLSILTSNQNRMFPCFLHWSWIHSEIRNTFLMIEQHFWLCVLCVYLLLLLLFPFLYIIVSVFDPSDTLRFFHRLYRWFQHVTILFMVRSAFLYCDIFIFQCQAISDSNELFDEQARDSQLYVQYLTMYT